MRYYDIYTLADWMDESEIIGTNLNHPGCSPLGSCFLPCPCCRMYGLDSPRSDGKRNYRACKLCGFWQNVGEVAVFAYLAVCPHYFSDGGAAYRLPTSKLGICPTKYCHAQMQKTYLPIERQNPRHVQIIEKVYKEHSYQLIV